MFVDCVTYRMGVHTTADDPKRYRSEEDVQRWQERDPLIRFEKYLLEKAVLSSEKIESIQAGIEKRIQVAVEAAEEQMRTMGAPLEMFDHLYAEPVPYLELQKEQLKQELT